MSIFTRSRTKLGLNNALNMDLTKQDNSEDEPPQKRNKTISEIGKPTHKENINSLHSGKKITENENNNVNVRPASSISENSSSSTDSHLTLKVHHAQLKNLISQEYVDIVKRLKLNFLPNCVQDMTSCKDNHSKESPEPIIASPYVKSKPNHLITENRSLYFLNMVEDLCNRTYFIGDEVFSSIFELILTINPPEDHDYTSDYVINECSLVFDKLITTFPPCWHAIRKYYDKFLTSPINISKFIVGKSDSNAKNIMSFVIITLEETIHLKNDNKIGIGNDDNEETTDLNESNFFNFREWELRNCNVHSFDSHSRDEKLDRLFVSLHLLTKLFELDLSLWMLRYITKPSKHIFANEKPLIVKVFDMNELVQITEIVKKLLRIYVICISFGYPEAKIDILSRLVSLLSVVINLAETETTVYGVIYPKIGTTTITFSKEIIKTIENCVGACIAKYLLIIENIKIPFIKYLLIDNLLTKLNAHSGQMCPKKIFENFTKRWWTKCARAPKDMIQENGTVYRPNDKQKLTTEVNKYPIIENIQNKHKSSEIYREEYLQLLLEALKSYCDLHATEKFALILMNKNNELSKNKRKLKNKSNLSPKSGKLNLEKIEKDLSTLLKSLNYQEENSFLEIELPIYDNVFIDSDTMIKYNEDIKYMMRLKKNIPLMKVKFGSEFNNWELYINQFFPSINE